MYSRGGSTSKPGLETDYARFGQVCHQYAGDKGASSYTRMINPLNGVENLDGFTVSLWVKRTDTSDNYNALWGFFGSTNLSLESARLYFTGNSYLGFNDNTNNWFDINHPETKVVSSIDKNTWRLITVTYSNENGCVLYRDGTKYLSTNTKYKGSVADYAHLPSSGQVVGDVYNVEDTGDNYAWAGSAWDKLAGTVDLSSYFNKSNDDADDILEGSSHLFLTSAERTKLSNTSGVNTGDQSASDFDIKDLADSTDLRNTWSGKQDAISDLATIRSNASGAIQASAATFVSNTVSEGADGSVTVTAADNVTVATAETNNKAAISALGTAHNNLVDRVEAVESAT